MSSWGFPLCGGDRQVSTMTRCDKSYTRDTANTLPKCLGELKATLSGHRVPGTVGNEINQREIHNPPTSSATKSTPLSITDIKLLLISPIIIKTQFLRWPPSWFNNYTTC